MVSRRLGFLPDPGSARVLSLGCGIGDTEILLAPYVKQIDLQYHFPAYTGLAPKAVEDGGDVAALRGTEVTLHVQPTLKVISEGRITAIFAHPRHCGGTERRAGSCRQALCPAPGILLG